MPSKALLAAAAARHSAGTGPFPGIVTQAGPVNMAVLIGGKDSLVTTTWTEKYTRLTTDWGWHVIAGTARLAGTAATPRLEVSLSDGGSTTI